MLTNTDLVYKLIGDPHYAELSILATRADGDLKTLKGIHGDVTSMPRLAPLENCRAADDATRNAMETVMITFAVYAPLRKIPPMKSHERRVAEIQGLKKTCAAQGVVLDDTNLPAHMDNILGGEDCEEAPGGNQ